MDRVRFGRALGKGARAAARVAVEAVDAATTTSPSTAQTSSANAPSRTVPARSVQSPGHAVAGEVLRAAPAFTRAARQAAGGVAAPVRAASRALWHELTGSFFALFALSFATGVWHTRAMATSPLAQDRHRFYAFCLLALLFAYFSVSSFMRARRRPAA